MRVYLGTHKPHWLASALGPMFISRQQFWDGGRPRRTLPRSSAPWVCDSGGFTHLGTYGEWRITVAGYAAEIDRYRREIGRLEWAAPMDYMCEPRVLAKTRLTVAEHQRRTITNFCDLRDRLGSIIAPVLQGWTVDEYLRHADMYQQAGVCLTYEPIVAIGSICRREQDGEIHRIIRRLAAEGLRLHALGVRTPALLGTCDVLASSDSMSWSRDARYAAQRGELPDHPHKRGGRTCANCQVYAERWRTRMLAQLERSILYEGEAA